MLVNVCVLHRHTNTFPHLYTYSQSHSNAHIHTFTHTCTRTLTLILTLSHTHSLLRSRILSVSLVYTQEKKDRKCTCRFVHLWTCAFITHTNPNKCLTKESETTFQYNVCRHFLVYKIAFEAVLLSKNIGKIGKRNYQKISVMKTHLSYCF